MKEENIVALILTQEQMEYLGNAQKAIGNILDSCQALEAGDKGTANTTCQLYFRTIVGKAVEDVRRVLNMQEYVNGGDLEVSC